MFVHLPQPFSSFLSRDEEEHNVQSTVLSLFPPSMAETTQTSGQADAAGTAITLRNDRSIERSCVLSPRWLNSLTLFYLKYGWKSKLDRMVSLALCSMLVCKAF